MADVLSSLVDPVATWRGLSSFTHSNGMLNHAWTPNNETPNLSVQALHCLGTAIFSDSPPRKRPARPPGSRLQQSRDTACSRA
eukprot:1189084-Pyramimonas_sp.AAC.1